MSVKEIKKAINNYDSFLISAHINPEGDSIGSQLGVAFLLERLGKKFAIVNESPVPHNLRFMPGTESISRKRPEGFDFEAAIILDCPDMSRIGEARECIADEKKIINIDHHVSNEEFGDYNWVSPEASSVGEMIYELYQAFGIKKFSYKDALAIYVAIMTDTGSFKYSNTTSLTHEKAAGLIRAGVNPYDIFSRIYESNSIQDLNLLGESLSTLKVTGDGKVAWLWVTREMLKKTKASLEGTEGIINFARSIEGVEVAVLFRETGTEDRVKVSFRSKGMTDVNKLASFFKGGGHKTASGCVIFGKIHEVEKKVIDQARKIV